MGKVALSSFIFFSCYYIVDSSSHPLSIVDREYHSNGELQYEAHYLNGELHGSLKSWNEFGVLLSMVEYRRGELHGKWLEYYPSGKLMHSVDYVSGQKSGRELWYHSNGKLQSESYHSIKDINPTIKRWDESGQEIAN